MGEEGIPGEGRTGTLGVGSPGVGTPGLIRCLEEGWIQIYTRAVVGLMDTPGEVVGFPGVAHSPGLGMEGGDLQKWNCRMFGSKKLNNQLCQVTTQTLAT